MWLCANQLTDESGQYAFSDLPAGNFQVGISGYDTDDYSFETTSKNVALALGETATVPFEGILLRTSGISGRVSVEGMGLDSVMVTLSGDDLADDMTTMTDASGQYAIAGLAEGDYTVAISGYDDVSYIFDMTSMDVTLGDDDTQIVNFMGMHARTASVTVRLFVDELAKNNLRDDGEHAFPSADMLAGVDPQSLPVLLAGLNSLVTLAGPGVHDTNMGQVNPADGSFVFAGLKAGDYQLMVNEIPATLVAALPLLQDYAYGGPAAGYAIDLTVGQAAMQDVPIDITHTTVNFGVTLKAGAKLGPPLEGASVTLYRDAAGTLKIDDAMTGATGQAAIRIARAGTTGNTVYAAVAAPAGSYHTSGAMQPVPWNPQYPATVASNDADIVNTMASFSFSGATIMTDMGGGMALGGWAVSVTSGDEAVDGAPTKLGADGSAKFSETVAAGDLPKSYKVEMAGWEDQSNDTLTGDGGERYTSTTVSHSHDGLSLSGTSTDAGTLEVTYTTQRLRVYVHQENDQVMGYTGNVLGGDVRMGGIIDVDIEHIGANGRANNFEAMDSVKSSAGGGVYQFWNVPAAANVIVSADEVATLGKDKDGNDIANTNHLLDKNGHSDEIAAYVDRDANGITGGAFGAHGGFHHTVDLCPLMSDEGNQRHGECSTFAFVETFAVDGQAWKYVRNKSSDDFASANSKAGVKGLTVSMDPVEGENLAMEDESFTDETGRTLKFDFGHMPAGVYKVTAPDGWIAQRGPLDSPTNDLAARLNPLDSALNIDVTPKTGYAYGTVTDADNRRLAGVSVNVNGVSVTTDSNGRYVAEGFGSSSYRAPGSRTTQRNVIVVRTAEEGSEETVDLGSFAANTPRRIDVEIEDAAEVTMISGRVTHSDGGAGVGSVRVWVDGRAPLNPNARTSSRLTRNNIYVTNSNGDFTVRVRAKAGGASATVTVSKDDMFFSPDQHTVGAVAGATISGINFTAFDNGRIHGRVVDGSNNPIGGVLVTAQQVGGTAMDTMTTTANTGSYTLSVRYGQYGVTAAKAGYTFTDTTGVNVPNDGKALNDLVGTAVENYSLLSSLSLSGVSLCRGSQPCGRTMGGFQSAHTDYTATVGNSTDMTTVTATAGGGARVTEIYPGDADATASGHQIELDVGTTDIEIMVVASDNTDTTAYNVAVTRRATSTTITGTITDTQTDEDGNTVGVAGVQVTVTGAGDMLNGRTVAGRTYVTTNSSGQYTAIMESGGTGTVTPTKTGYSFDPASRQVTLNADSVEGINFTGSSYATITGTVVDDNGGALEGATVTATSGGVSDSDDTDRRGRFSVSVPAGTATITVVADGYQFGSQTVNVAAGESRAFGAIRGSPSTDVSLSSVTVNGEEVEAEADGSYSHDVDSDVMMATIVATPSDGGADVEYSGDDADDATDGHQVELSAGANVTTVTVTAAAGAPEKEYTVTVNRTASDDATLSALSLSDDADPAGDVALDPVFASDVDEYTADVGVDVSEVTVTATANQAGAEVGITPADADAATDGHQVALGAAGTDTEITVTVTAEDASTQAYTVTVSRSDGHQAPSEPTSFEVETGDQSATLTWRAPRQIGSSAITGYDWEATAPQQPTRSGTLDPASSPAVDGVFTQAVSDPNSLVNGATYTFKVWAVNTKGTPAENVRGPAATAEAKAQPAITLTLVDTDGSTPKTTLLEEQDTDGDTIYATVSLSNPSIEAITVTVVEKFAAGATANKISQVKIENPTIVIAAGSTTAASTADPAKITAKDDVVDDDAVGALVQATSDDAIDSDADTGTDGLQPTEITITDDDDLAGAPQNLSASVADKSSFVQWQAPADNGSSDITHYEIRYAVTADIADAEWATVAGGATAANMTISGLTNDSGYTIEVRAVTAAGNGPAATTTVTPTG